MNFLIDAQLPRRLSRWLKAEGHDAIHTLDLPTGNRTEDTRINALSIREQRVVVTKDTDFVDTFLLQRAPCKLLLVATGNIANPELVRLFEDNLDAIVQALETSDFVELGRDSLISHQ
jgi:predicted nuclease of predicted toxin-antitoxin system